MEALSLQKTSQTFNTPNPLFIPHQPSKDFIAAKSLSLPQDPFPQSLMNIEANACKLPAVNLMREPNPQTRPTIKTKPSSLKKKLKNKRRVDENDWNFAQLKKRKLIDSINSISRFEVNSPCQPKPKTVQNTLIGLIQEDADENKENKWQTPQKKLHVFWDVHENEKQTKMSELKNKIFETDYSRFANDYEVIEVLGRGSFGKVFRCLNKVDKNEYAIKETYRSFTGKNKVYGLNETQALASLSAIEDNLHVVRYYNSWVEDDKLYLVMEFCPSSLREQQKTRQSFSEGEVKKILRDICLGLAYLHRHNIVHLDVKPDNILISKNGNFKIGDMGQSRLVKKAGDIDEGDSRFVAPELLNCDDSEDGIDLKKCDIFSLGLTAFELLTNHQAPPNGEEWHRLRNGDLTLLEEASGISSHLKNLIKRMLNKNPFERPFAADILAQDLPSEMDLRLKWEKIENQLLRERKTELEGKLLKQRSRRNSIP